MTTEPQPAHCWRGVQRWYRLAKGLSIYRLILAARQQCVATNQHTSCSAGLQSQGAPSWAARQPAGLGSLVQPVGGSLDCHAVRQVAVVHLVLVGLLMPKFPAQWTRQGRRMVRGRVEDGGPWAFVDSRDVFLDVLRGRHRCRQHEALQHLYQGKGVQDEGGCRSGGDCRRSGHDTKGSISPADERLSTGDRPESALGMHLLPQDANLALRKGGLDHHLDCDMGGY
jgi:hypothetical protein